MEWTIKPSAKYYDSVVAAKFYIGPMYLPTSNLRQPDPDKSRVITGFSISGKNMRQ